MGRVLTGRYQASLEEDREQFQRNPFQDLKEVAYERCLLTALSRMDVG